MTDTKMCPYCGEEVKLEAIKCKHCHSMLSEEDNALVGAVATTRPQQAAIRIQKPIWKRWWVWVIVGLLVIAIIGGGNGNDEEVADKPEEAVEGLAEITPTSLVSAVVGVETNHSEEEFKNPIIEVGIDGEAFNIILIGNDNLSTDYIKRKMLIDSCELFEKAFAELPEINSTYIDWHFPLVDTYGNVELNSVMTIKLTRETEDKINWENFMTDNLPDVADFYWQHVAIN